MSIRNWASVSSRSGMAVLRIALALGSVAAAGQHQVFAQVSDNVSLGRDPIGSSPEDEAKLDAQKRRIAEAIASGKSPRSEDFIGLAPNEAFEFVQLKPKPVSREDARPPITARQIILNGRGNTDLTPGNDQPTIATPTRPAPGKMQQFDPNADPADVGNMAMQAQIDAEREERAGITLGVSSWLPILLLAGSGLLAWGLLKRPIRQIRMGLHLTAMTNIVEEMELTRQTMPIGAGGGVDSLPLGRQRQADRILDRGMSFMRNYPRHVVTRELVKNAALADRLGRSGRAFAISRLIEILESSGIALGLDDFAKSYSD